MKSLRILSASVCLTVLTGASLATAADGQRLSNQGWELCLQGRLRGAMLHRNLITGDPLRWDAATGNDARNYPIDPQADFQHMTLEIDIPDMDSPQFTASETLTFQPIGRAMSTLTLDAKRLTIRRVALSSSGQNLDWSHDGMKLQLRFDPPLEAGVSHDLQIEYTLDDPIEGLYWSPARAEAPGRPARDAQLYSQGEADMNSNWFICHDFPNDKLTTELIATVPEGFLVSSNGELILEQTRGGRTTFHWKQDLPHVSYLVTFVVGKFDVVDVGDDRLSLPVYTPPGLGGLVQQTYGPTMDMIRVFEDRLDEPYPWARYANVLVWNFGWGGMENTSATTLYDTAVLDAKSLQDADLDGLNSHELGHQWFGDLLTCNSWEHIWLNEGFATYLESLWLESRDGFDNGYLLDTYRNNRGVASMDRLDTDNDRAWSRPAMVSKLFAGPDDVFRRSANPYPKGSSILHMLRMKLSDDVFFKGLQTYVDRFKFKTVETSDFRRVMEEVSGLSLEQFFDQWAYRPGTPEVNVASDWSYEKGELHLVVEQTQRIDDMTPAFAFTLPVLVIGEDGGQTWVEIDVTGRRHEKTVSLDQAPTMVVVDPYLTVLMTPSVDQPTRQIITQLRHGPTIAARLDAAAFLKERDETSTISALTDSLRDRKEHFAVRSAAAGALGELHANDELLAALEAGLANAKVRRAVVRALDEIGDADSVQAFAKHAGDPDESYAVRAASLAALGSIGDRTNLDILLAALEEDSQHDQVRVGALRGLAALDEPEGLDQAIRFSQLGWLARTRPVAIRAIGELADHDSERAIDVLIQLLDDPEERAREAAGRALSKVGDENALAEMRRVARTHRQPSFRKNLTEWADQLAAKLAENDSDADLRKQIKQLQLQVEELAVNEENKD